MEHDLVALARDVPDAYADLDGLRMALLTGSVARGLADNSSDVDVYLSWDTVDRDALASAHRCESIGARLVTGLATPTGYFEKYRLGRRFLDVESVETAALEQLARALAGGDVPDGAIKQAAGLRDAQAIVGADELARWQSRLSFTDAFATAEVAVRSRRLLSARRSST